MLNNLFPNVRPRRLRKNKTIRGLVSETKLLKSKLIQPLFVSESISKKQPNPVFWNLPVSEQFFDMLGTSNST